eukprot:8315897-Karenia_brevis.AAC.1
MMGLHIVLMCDLVHKHQGQKRVLASLPMDRNHKNQMQSHGNRKSSSSFNRNPKTLHQLLMLLGKKIKGFVRLT